MANWVSSGSVLHGDHLGCPLYCVLFGVSQSTENSELKREVAARPRLELLELPEHRLDHGLPVRVRKNGEDVVADVFTHW